MVGAQQRSAVALMPTEGTLFVYCTYGISCNGFCLCAMGTHTIITPFNRWDLVSGSLGRRALIVFAYCIVWLYGFYPFVLTCQSFRHYCSQSFGYHFIVDKGPTVGDRIVFYVGSPYSHLSQITYPAGFIVFLSLWPHCADGTLKSH